MKTKPTPLIVTNHHFDPMWRRPDKNTKEVAPHGADRLLADAGPIHGLFRPSPVGLCSSETELAGTRVLGSWPRSPGRQGGPRVQGKVLEGGHNDDAECI